MKKNHRVRLGIVAALATVLAVQAASPAGTWSMNANGYKGTLVLTIDAAGTLGGTLQLGNEPVSQIKGFWSDLTGELTFYRVNNLVSTPPDRIQIFTGYWWPSITYTNGHLAGYFEAVSALGGTGLTNVFGWSAIGTTFCPSGDYAHCV
jgi:hypothetical protein